MRVPTVNVSVMNLSVVVSADVSVASINAAIREAPPVLCPTCWPIPMSRWRPVILITTRGQQLPDLGQTRVSGSDLVKVLTWFDNEWGFANRMLDVSALAEQAAVILLPQHTGPLVLLISSDAQYGLSSPNRQQAGGWPGFAGIFVCLLQPCRAASLLRHRMHRAPSRRLFPLAANQQVQVIHAAHPEKGLALYRGPGRARNDAEFVGRIAALSYYVAVIDSGYFSGYQCVAGWRLSRYGGNVDGYPPYPAGTLQHCRGAVAGNCRG